MTSGPGGAACAAAAGLAGATLVLAFPPYDLWPVAAAAPVPLCWIASHPRVGRGAAVLSGLAFGVAFFCGSVYWVVPVMRRFGGLSLPAALGVLLALVAYLAAFPAAVHRLARRRGTLPALLAAPAVWAALELARNHLLTGFPWVRLGTALHAAPALLQLASVTGVYGLSALLLSIAAAAAALASAPGRGAAIYAAAAAAAALGVAAAGSVRLRAAPAGEPLPVACVQGNVPQDRKWDPEEAQAILDRHARLTEAAARAGARLIVWPESSMPFALRAYPSFARAVQDLAAGLDVSLLVGSLDRRPGDGGSATYNAAFLVDRDGRIAAVYDKIHLVPFGEYVPWRRVLWWAGSLVEEVADLRPGSGPGVLRGAAGLPPLGVQICYEIIFPELPRRAVGGGATLLLNITNDAWFGDTSAPHQHFAEAVVRAAETGRWVVRAANTGVSGLIDARGRVVARSRLGETTIVQGVAAACSARTPYGRTGDLFAWTCAILAAAALVSPGGAAPASEPRPRNAALAGSRAQPAAEGQEAT
jgi:apolipoprotein N-acyltransferase